MCGIAGIISVNPRLVTQQRLQLMTDAIRHRGPEGDGFWISNSGTVGFGHRRLAIIDLSQAGSQPMHYRERYTIVYNGEIYNYKEVQAELQQKGYTFKSHCDTEVILAAYACYGLECLQRFDGMFAFAIWDEAERTLFCARDRFGEKPFYFSQQQDQFLFASEMKSLWAIGVEKRMDDAMLQNYLGLGVATDPQNAGKTFFENILQLPAAHYLYLKVDDYQHGHLPASTQSYWDIDQEGTKPTSEHEASEHFLYLLSTSVERRLRSDVAIGTSLSGGLDSSSIVAVIHRHLQQNNQYKQASFSAVFPGFFNDESKHITQVAAAFNLRSYTTTPTSQQLIESIEKLAWHQEEPVQSSSIFAQYKVYELAAQHGVTVLLDGQGADETLAGYHKYFNWYWQELLARGEFNKCSTERHAAEQNGVRVDWGVKNILAAYMPSLAATMLQKKAANQLRNIPFINSEYFQNSGKTIFKPVITHLNQALYFNTLQSGLQELLRYADRNSMAQSREVRLPFLSHELVEFVFSLPSDHKIKDGFTKYILRSSMKNKLPENIVWRKDKVGFEPPQKQWMEEPGMKAYIRDSKKALVNEGVLLPSVLDQEVKPQHAHDADNYDWRYLSAWLSMRS